jgi:transcriptional regulator PpsR
MSTVETFDARVGALGWAGGQTVAAIIKASTDIALVLDSEGVIRDLHLPEASPLDSSREWLGQEWQDTVTGESRPKIDAMLRAARVGDAPRRRQVTHALPSGAEVPVAYTAIRIGPGGEVVALGRDLRSVAALQQRLVEAQQAMERDYWRMRHIETRYRLLFQLSGEAVLVVDGTTRKVVDANPAAARMFGVTAKQLLGKPAPIPADAAKAGAIDRHLASVRSQGEADPITLTIPSAGEVRFSASLLRQDATELFLIRLVPESDGTPAQPSDGGSRLLRALQNAPDGFVVTDPSGTILAANRAFLDLVELPTEDQARGESLGRWIGRPGADLGVLLSTLREHGVLRLVSTAVQGEFGFSSEVEVSAAAANGDQPCIGFAIRDVGRRLEAPPRGARDLTRAVEQLTGLVGRVSLKELVRDTTSIVEQHFIQAALELTDDNRTSAAEVLGVSRQSLYVKLRRYGFDLADPDHHG